MDLVGEDGTLVEGERCVPVAENKCAQTLVLQRLAQAVGEGKSHVFFCQLIAERRSPFVAAVAGVHHGKVAAGTAGESRRRGASRLRWRSCWRNIRLRSWHNGWDSGNGLRRGHNGDSPPPIAETGEQRSVAGDHDFRGAVVFLI